MLRITFAMCLLVLLLQAAIDAGKLEKNRGQKTPTNKDAGQLAKNRGQQTPTNKDAGQLAKNQGQQTSTNKDAGQLAKNRGQQTPTNKDAGQLAKNRGQQTSTNKDAGQLAKNRKQQTSTNKGVPGRGINLGRASGGLEQENRPLPPPSNGWIVIMQRFDFSLDFNRNWTEYKNGFGELGLQKEFWLGNDAIHLLTSGVPHKLRVEILANGTLFYADYDSFSIDSEDTKYQLHVSGYSGNAGDSLTNKTADIAWYLDGVNFLTPVPQKDNSTDDTCADSWHAGWWYTGRACWWACLTCKLDGKYALWETAPSSINPKGVRMRIMRK